MQLDDGRVPSIGRDTSQSPFFTALQRMTQRTKNGADNPRRMKDKNAKEWLDVGAGKVSICECIRGRAREWELTRTAKS
jgi:hypothetical protein